MAPARASAAWLALLTLPATAGAQAIDLSHGGPVNVTAVGGIDWDQAAQTVTAHEDARAIRGNVTITADQLIAHYRKKAGSAGAPVAKPAEPPTTAPASAGDTGNNEIYRFNAVGRVHIFTQTDQAWGDAAVYDIDQAVLVLTGNGLRLTTPQDVLTARDAMEYWSVKHMAIARGDASATSADGRRITADTLVGYTTPAPASPAGVKPSSSPGKVATGTGSDPIAGGKLQRVEAYGHVQVRTISDIVTGDRGVYLPDTGLARIFGHVHVTRGANQLNGAEAVVNMKTGLATMHQAPGGRVQGLVVPNASDKVGAAPARRKGAS